MTKSNATGLIIFAALMVSILGFTGLAHNIHPRYDSGAYIIAAKSIAGGMGLKHIAHPENPPFTTYPPVIPVLLAPFAAFAKEGFLGLKLAMLLFFSITVFSFALAYKRFFPSVTIIPALALLGSGSLLAFAGRIQGETPFTLFGLLSAFLAYRFLETRNKLFLLGTLASLLLTCFSRQVGIAWAVGVLIGLPFAPRKEKKGWKNKAILGLAGLLIIILVILPWAIHINSIQPGALSPESTSVLRADGWDGDKGQISLLSKSLLGRVKMNMLNSGIFAPESLFYKYEFSKNRLTQIILLPLFFLIISGFIYKAIKKPSVFETITISYCGLIFITPWLKEPRFFTVILPFLILYLYEGLKVFFKYVIKAGNEKVISRAFWSICCAIFIFNLFTIITDDKINPWSAKNNPDFLLAQFSGKDIPKESVVLAHDHCSFYLLTGNKSLSFTKSEQKFLPYYKLDSYLNRGGKMDYIAWVKGDDVLVNKFLQDKGWETTKVKENNDFRLHKFVW